jgi:predicted nucleotidyltransferase
VRAALHCESRLDVFGSILGGDFREGESDVDLLVEFAPMEPYARVKACFALRHELEEILGVTVDLVVRGAVKNAVIAREIDRAKQALYAA